MKQEETAILSMADLHVGKETETYNRDVFVERMDALVDKTLRIRELLSDHDFDKLVILALGDFNDGTGIFPGQGNYQDITDPEKQADFLADYLTDWTRRMRNIWNVVEWECVPGNHGRSGKYAAEAANWDKVCYRYLQKNLKDDEDTKVSFNEKGDVFIRKVEIRGHHHLLYHGHDIRMYQSIPWYGINNRMLRWYTCESIRPFDVAWFGHFHTSSYETLNTLTAMLTGCLPTDDPWTIRTLGYEGINQWWLCGCSDSRPLTFKFSLEVA